MINIAFVQNLLTSTITMTTPILIVAVGELFSEHAGLVNIGLDGIMSFGALAGFLICYKTGSPLMGFLAGAAAGVAINMIYAFFTITLCTDQIVYGMAINLLAPALASFIYRLSFSNTSTLIQGISMKPFAIPEFSRIPFIGHLLFDYPPFIYLTYLFIIGVSIFFNKTKPGLNFKAVGEFPKAAETMGIQVIKIKYIAAVFCGALSGLGGAFLTVCYTNTYTDGIVAGRGFIALATVIFGRWSAGGILAACLSFGFCDALQIQIQLMSPHTPYHLLQMIPYLCTLFVLIFFGNKKNGPEANGQPYFREKQ